MLSLRERKKSPMTLQIDLRPDLEAKLRSRAAAQGKDLSAFAQEVLEKSAQGDETLAEILGPIRRDIRQSGMSDAELDSLIEQAIEGARRDRKPKA